MRVIVISICLIIAELCFSQSVNDCLDIVYLKDGSKLMGTLKEVKIGEYLILNSISGLEVKVESRFLKKIVQQCEGKTSSVKDNSIFDKGTFIGLRSQFLPGISYSDDFQIGLGSQLVIGQRLNSNIGFGLSLGFEKFALNDIEDKPTFPLMAEISGLIGNKGNSPSYNLGFGYAFAGHKDAVPGTYRSIIEYNGGLCYHGMVGLRLSNHMRINMGVRFQHTSKEWNYYWIENPTPNKDYIVNKRLILGIEYIW